MKCYWAKSGRLALGEKPKYYDLTADQVLQELKNRDMEVSRLRAQLLDKTPREARILKLLHTMAVEHAEMITYL
jgi:hypothetical protein